MERVCETKEGIAKVRERIKRFQKIDVDVYAMAKALLSSHISPDDQTQRYCQEPECPFNTKRPRLPGRVVRDEDGTSISKFCMRHGQELLNARQQSVQLGNRQWAIGNRRWTISDRQ